MKRQVSNAIRKFVGIHSDTDFYSQGGEDAIVWNTFRYVIGLTQGFYLDVGAYHPFRHSNTYLLYKAGWWGMNIDPRPGTKQLFDRFRKGDINVEAGIAEQDGTLTYYVVGEDSTMNTFSRENLERLGIFHEVKATIEVPVYSMSTLLAKHPEVENIDYLNIDAEGFELEILRGFDELDSWPAVISLEQNGVFSLTDVLSSGPNQFLTDRGYETFAKNLILDDVATVFYMKKDRRGS